MSQTLQGRQARVNAIHDALPRCLGRWISGSNGDPRFDRACSRLATWWDPNSSTYALCDEHWHELLGCDDPVDWDDEVRQYTAYVEMPDAEEVRYRELAQLARAIENKIEAKVKKKAEISNAITRVTRYLCRKCGLDYANAREAATCCNAREKE